MLGELDKLEGLITQAAETIRLLREENRRLAQRIAACEEEQKRFLEERAQLAERVTRLVDKVDALRMEL